MARKKVTFQFRRGGYLVTRVIHINQLVDETQVEEWYDYMTRITSTIESYQASITFLSENNATHNNQFNETLTLVQSELEYNKQNLKVLTNSCGVYYEAQVLQDRNKTFLFDFSNDGRNVIQLTGVVDGQGRAVNDIRPFQNIGDLVVGVFRRGTERAIDVFPKDRFATDSLYRERLALNSRGFLSVLMQDIGRQGHDSDDDLSSFVGFIGRRVAKVFPNEQGGRSTVFGTVMAFQDVLLNPHGNYPLEKAQFTINYDFQDHHDVVDVDTLSEYLANYRELSLYQRVVNL